MSEQLTHDRSAQQEERVVGEESWEAASLTWESVSSMYERPGSSYGFDLLTVKNI